MFWLVLVCFFVRPVWAAAVGAGVWALASIALRAVLQAVPGVAYDGHVIVGEAIAEVIYGLPVAVLAGAAASWIGGRVRAWRDRSTPPA